MFRFFNKSRRKAKNDFSEPVAPEKLYDYLLKTIEWLAGTTEEQVRFFAAHAHRYKGNVDIRALPDELALECKYITSFAPNLVESGYLQESQSDELKALSDWFGTMTQKKDMSLWTLESLQVRPEWQQARMQAGKLLASLKKRET